MINLIDNLVLSATSIKTFENCPRQFYLYKTEKPTGGTGSQLILGGTVHEVCDLVNKKQIKTEHQAISKFKSLYNDECTRAKNEGRPVSYSQWSNYRKDIREGSAMAAAYVRFFSDLPVIGSEVSLLSEIKTKSKIWTIEGHIDIVLGIYNEDQLVGYDVVDIKTGKSTPTDLYLDQDLQLESYCYALKTGKFVKVERGAENKNYVMVDIDIDRSIPILRKSIYNIREAIDSKGNILDSVSGRVIYSSGVMSEGHFIKTFNAITEHMITCEDNEYWPKHIGGIHDSPCRWCDYCDVCKGQE